MIAGLGNWRGEWLAEIRRLIHEVNPDLDSTIGKEFLANSVYIAADILRQTNDDQDAAGFRDCLYNLAWSGAIGDNYSFDDNGGVVGVSHVLIEALPFAERTDEKLGYRILGPPPTQPVDRRLLQQRAEHCQCGNV